MPELRKFQCKDMSRVLDLVLSMGPPDARNVSFIVAIAGVASPSGMVMSVMLERADAIAMARWILEATQ